LDEGRDGHENREDLAPMEIERFVSGVRVGRMLTWPNESVNWFSLELYTPSSMQATQYVNGMMTTDTK